MTGGIFNCYCCQEVCTVIFLFKKKKTLPIILKSRLVAGATEKLWLVTDFPLSIQVSFLVLTIPIGYMHHL